MIARVPQRNLAGAGSGWRDVALGDCIEMNDATYAPREDWPFINYLDTGNLTRGRIDAIQHLVTGEDDIPSRARRKVKSGDMLYSTVRPNQRHFGIIREVPDNLLASTGFAVIRGKAGRAHTDFIYWFLAQDSVVEYLHTIAEHSASAYPSIRPADIERLRLRLPPLSEQRAIASVLGGLDDKIKLNHRMAATLDEAGRALFKSWFIDLDPVRAKSERASAVGPSKGRGREVPAGWSVRALDEMAHFQNGLALQKHRPEEGENYLSVLKIAHLRREALDGKERASANIHPGCVVENGDLIFSWSGSLMVKVWCGGRAALNQHLFKVTPIDALAHPAWFILHWLHEHIPDLRSIASDKATTMGHIKRHHLSDALCVVPGDEVMRAAANVFRPMHERCIAAKVESGRLGQLRDALLPKLVSGAIRIPDAEEIVEAAT